MDSIENIANFLELDQHGKATLLAGKLGVPFSENTNELIHAIGAALAGDVKISPKKPDWKDVIRQYGIQEYNCLDCCLASDDPTHCKNLPIRLAAQNGFIEAVKTLLQDTRVNPAAQDNSAICSAAYYCHYEVARLLLRDPRVNLKDAIASAKRIGSKDTVAALKKLKE